MFKNILHYDCQYESSNLRCASRNSEGLKPLFNEKGRSCMLIRSQSVEASALIR